MSVELCQLGARLSPATPIPLENPPYTWSEVWPLLFALLMLPGSSTCIFARMSRDKSSVHDEGALDGVWRSGRW